MKTKIAPPKITYDSESRILSLRLSKAQSVDSDVHENIVIDYDARGNPVNIEIMDCSLSEFRRVVPVRRYIRTRSRSRARA